MKDLLRTADLSPADVAAILDLAAALKIDPYGYRALLQNDTVVLYFNKPSTRTRISFETAVVRLGGVPVAVGPQDLQLGRGETIEDTAKVISMYSRAFVIRTYADEEVRRFAAASTIPVINALTDRHHPCQSLADLLTLREKRGVLKRCKLAYVGSGNNVAHSLLEAAALAGMHIAVATPHQYSPEAQVVATARYIGAETGARIELVEEPAQAATGADAIYTDVWLSMGDTDRQRAERVVALQPYQVNDALMAHAKPDAIFMHCLPDHRGEEVTAAVVDSPRSVVFDQAENRLHTAAAILIALLRRQLEGRRRQ